MKAAELTESDRENIYKGGVYVGHLKGVEEGIKLGESRANLRSAKAMLAEGFDIALISRLTGLSLEEVEAIRAVGN